jgi:hypothetical protein
MADAESELAGFKAANRKTQISAAIEGIPRKATKTARFFRISPVKVH